jgi:tryptophan synthase alpha chain
MNRIDAAFSTLRAAGRRGLMPFVCGGHPSAGVTRRVLPALERAGACVIEVGIPFSDPIADGPVIAAAMHEVLSRPNPATPQSVFDEVRQARPDTRAGLVAMVSISIVHRTGPGSFISSAAEAGFDGLIFPDVPLEESDELLGLTRDAGLCASLLVAPTTPPARAERIARACTGFVYLLARVGITGEQGRAGEAIDIGERVRLLRSATELPIACGFGISTPDQVRAVVRHADAAIVGSALVRRMSDASARKGDPVVAAEAFTRELAGALA